MAASERGAALRHSRLIAINFLSNISLHGAKSHSAGVKVIPEWSAVRSSEKSKSLEVSGLVRAAETGCESAGESLVQITHVVHARDDALQASTALDRRPSPRTLSKQGTEDSFYGQVESKPQDDHSAKNRFPSIESFDGELSIVKQKVKGKHNSGETWVLLSHGSRSLLALFSVLPYKRDLSHRRSVITVAASQSGAAVDSCKPRASMSVRLPLYRNDPIMKLLKLDEGQDVSFAFLLVGNKAFRNRPHFGEERTSSGVATQPSVAVAQSTLLSVTTPGPETPTANPPASPALATATVQADSQQPSASPVQSQQVQAQGPTQSQSAVGVVGAAAGSALYDASLLDDPDLRAGKHRTLMNFTSYLTSVIDYTRPSELKRELNERFKERFPYIDLTLSKLKSLKRDLLALNESKKSIDLWTLAQSYVYFEKLVLKGFITKANRKLCCGASILLAAKLNDTKGTDLDQLIQDIEETFRVSKRDLFAFEFGTFLALDFTLHIPDAEILPHYRRLLHRS